MPRKPKSAAPTFKEAPVDLGDGITVLITYPEGKRPRIVWNDNHVEVTNGAVPQRQFPQQYMLEPQEPSETNGPTRDEPWMREFVEKRKAGAAPEVPQKRVFTTEDAAAESGMALPSGFLDADNMLRMVGGIKE